MTSFRSQHSRSSSPINSEPAEAPFCSTCEHNQALVQKLIAEYLPDDDHPEYEQYVAAYDDYRAELEDRYPQVCNKCAARVNEQMEKAEYIARSDHLRRVMERSIQKRQVVLTTRQSLTLRLISLAKWSYILSLLVQMLWHVFGMMMAPDERLWDTGEETPPLMFSAETCLRQAFQEQSVDDCCVLSSNVTSIVAYTIFADALTLWWNPKLRSKTNSITGRMRGLKRLWATRIVVLLLRGWSLYSWSRNSVQGEAIHAFHNVHTFMLVILAVSALLTWKLVSITYQKPSFTKSNGTNTSLPGSAKKNSISSYRPAHPAAGSFDTMAQQFSTGFDDENGSAAFPPSPTLTDASFSTEATAEAATPYAHKTIRLDENDMDWTPEKPRLFAAKQPTVYATPWPQQQPSPPKLASHSIFAQPDPNPFRHKVPAAPKAPAQAVANPWKPSVWAPPLKENAPNFFAEQRKTRGGSAEPTGLDGYGVPKNVKRNAELFASPKLKYDNYGTVKDTGLEETFNGLFQK